MFCFLNKTRVYSHLWCHCAHRHAVILNSNTKVNQSDYSLFWGANECLHHISTLFYRNKDDEQYFFWKHGHKSHWQSLWLWWLIVDLWVLPVTDYTYTTCTYSNYWPLGNEKEHVALSWYIYNVSGFDMFPYFTVTLQLDLTHLFRTQNNNVKCRWSRKHPHPYDWSQRNV